jgi:hypothetical protein
MVVVVVSMVTDIVMYMHPQATSCTLLGIQCRPGLYLAKLARS